MKVFTSPKRTRTCATLNRTGPVYYLKAGTRIQSAPISQLIAIHPQFIVNLEVVKTKLCVPLVAFSPVPGRI